MIKSVDGLLSRVAHQLVRVLCVFLFACFSWVVSAQSVEAASLYVSPATGSYAVGKTFTVNVMVSTPDQAANAYSGTVTYPSDTLEMTGLGKSGSVVSLLVQEPSSNATRATFEGVTFNPGYKGGAGRIISLTFKAKKAGSAVVRVSTGSILANDGEGTNILTGLGTATFTIGDGVEQPTTPEEPKEVTGKLGIPGISSPTHPDSAKWYSLNDATFKWGLANGVDAVNILTDQNASSDPGTSSDGLFSTYTYQDVKDGVWYAHLRVRNKNGWSGVSHFTFQIDTVKPEMFTIKAIGKDETNSSAYAFLFDAKDALSGISHYDVKVDDSEFIAWTDDGTHTYKTPPVSAGAHTLTARAVDKAGNYLESSATFTAEGIQAPLIVDYPKTANEGDSLVIKGTTYPDSQVTLWVQKEGGEAIGVKIQSDENGRFTYVADEKLLQGAYKIWATVTDSLGNISGPSEKISIPVKAPSFDFVAWILGIWAWIDLCMLTNLILLILLGLLGRKYLLMTKRLGHGVRGAQEAVHGAFDVLKDDIQKHITLLEKAKSKRELTQEEDRILKTLKRDLKVAEKNIRSQIDRIEKHL